MSVGDRTRSEVEAKLHVKRKMPAELVRKSGPKISLFIFLLAEAVPGRRGGIGLKFAIC